MAYYGEQGDLTDLPPESLERRARILHAMGEDDEKRGDLAKAEAKWAEARRTTAALLAQVPDDAERIFAHAQSEYWVGYAAYERKLYPKAHVNFVAYRNLAANLVAANPAKVEWMLEAGYAEGNLCSWALKSPDTVGLALGHCGRALRWAERAAAAKAGDAAVQASVINRLSWIARAYERNGDPLNGLPYRRRQLKLATELSARDPANADWQELLARAEISLAEALANGDATARDEAPVFARAASNRLSKLRESDPSNSTWSRLLARSEQTHALLGARTEGVKR